MKIYWSKEALAEFEAIILYIAKDNPNVADTFAEHIYSETELLLTEHPRTGRVGRVANTFELVIHKSYIVVYYIERNQITILSLRHTARLWPDAF